MAAKKLLIDGDMLVYRALAGTEHEVDWGNEIWTLHTNERAAWQKLGIRLKKISEELESDFIVLCFSGEGNFRKELCSSYKSNRANLRKPLLYRQMVDALIIKECPLELEFAVKQFQELEADDLLGMFATHPRWQGSTIIVSDDKDMKSIPGALWRYSEDDKEKRQVVEVSQAEADRWHLVQTLAGDQVDGYPGCPQIGLATAEELLDKRLKFVKARKKLQKGKRAGQWEDYWDRVAANTPWETVLSCFTRAEKTEEDALLQARLARILRFEDYDFEKGEPKLWTP